MTLLFYTFFMKYFILIVCSVFQFSFAQQVKTTIHKVVKGENIFQIAKMYNCTIADIYKLNPTAENGIQENQNLNIIIGASIKQETTATNNKIHLVVSGETLYSISRLYGLKPDILEKNNQELLKTGLKVGQKLFISEQKNVVENAVSLENKSNHIIVAKDNLFSIARLYNVSVQDLELLNELALKDGLQIGETINIPNKKKTLNGQARVINAETIFHTVEAKETKYSIAKKYGISIEKLEMQNPETINNLIIGSKLAINTSEIKPKNDNDELMIALAEKQVVIEKSKAKTIEIEELQDKLVVQKQINQKVLKVNALKVNLNEINETKGGSAKKLQLVLEANKNIQEILISKLDSLVITMSDDLETLKKTDIVDLEQSKTLERESYKNMGQTNDLLTELKKDLADNRKIYSGLMNKVQRISLAENQAYKKKVNQNQKVNNNSEDKELLAVIKNIQTKQEANEVKNKQLISKINEITIERNTEFKRKIAKATFYGEDARNYDDKLALVKLKRYQKKALEENKNLAAKTSKKPTAEQIAKALNTKEYKSGKGMSVEILKNLPEVENGFYIVVKTFKAAEPRDAYIKKMIDAGEINTSFFYNVNILGYYVFTKKFQTIDEAAFEYSNKINNQRYKDMVIVKILNEK
jgi:LysM repeat protein